MVLLRFSTVLDRLVAVLDIGLGVLEVGVVLLLIVGLVVAGNAREEGIILSFIRSWQYYSGRVMFSIKWL